MFEEGSTPPRTQKNRSLSQLSAAKRLKREEKTNYRISQSIYLFKKTTYIPGGRLQKVQVLVLGGDEVRISKTAADGIDVYI